jgi:hypothetical protein
VPTGSHFGPLHTIDEIYVIIHEAFLRPWVADDFAFDIEITSVNGGFHFHGTDLIPLSGTIVDFRGGGFADVTVLWTADTEEEDINDVYTACLQLVLGTTAIGPEICREIANTGF